jgi:hypothetical protein
MLAPADLAIAPPLVDADVVVRLPGRSLRCWRRPDEIPSLASLYENDAEPDAESAAILQCGSCRSGRRRSGSTSSGRAASAPAPVPVASRRWKIQDFERLLSLVPIESTCGICERSAVAVAAAVRPESLIWMWMCEFHAAEHAELVADPEASPPSDRLNYTDALRVSRVCGMVDDVSRCGAYAAHVALSEQREDGRPVLVIAGVCDRHAETFRR